MIQARSTNVPSNVVLERLQERFIEGIQASGITSQLGFAWMSWGILHGHRQGAIPGRRRQAWTFRSLKST
jgi:hypothetical protein